MKYFSNKVLKYFLLFLALSVLVPCFVTAQKYYVKSGGNDNLDGLTDATAWKTIQKVNQFTFKTGDDVYFKCGNKFSGSGNGLVIDWSGTISNRVTIGSYYLLNGKEVIGISGSKPIINGENIADNDWSALFEVLDGDNHYITLENLKFINSGGLGVKYKGSNSGEINNIDIAHTYRQGVSFVNSDDCILRNSDITDTDGSLNGAGVIMQYCNRTRIMNNVIHEIGKGDHGKGREGINLWLSDNSVVSNNIIYDCQGMGIYLDHTINATVEYNLIYYTGNRYFWRSSVKSAGGIVLTDEWVPEDVRRRFDHTAKGNIVHRNIIVNAGKGIELWSGSKNEIDPGLIDVKITGNIIVEPYSTDGSHRAISLDYSARNENSIIKDNIFFQSDGTIAKINGVSGLTLENNLWSKEPVESARSSSDPTYSKPKFTKQRSTGWSSIEAGSLKYDDFALQKGSVSYATIYKDYTFNLLKVKNVKVN